MENSNKTNKVLQIAKKLAQDAKVGMLRSEFLLLALLRGPECMAKDLLSRFILEDEVLEAMQMTIGKIDKRKKVEFAGLSPRTKELLMEAEKLAKKSESEMVEPEHILLSILLNGGCGASQILTAYLDDKMDLEKAIIDYLEMEDVMFDKTQSGKAVDERGQAKNINPYCKDITLLARENKLDPVIGREDEILRMIQILSRRMKNNPCLIGDPGVGKTAIVEGLALRIVSGDVPEVLQNKRVLSLDMSSMIAGTKYRGEFEDRIKKFIKEVTADKNIILFMDEIHTMIGAGASEGSTDAANMLKPALSRGELLLIGATTLEEYRKYMEKDAALVRRFQTVMVEEPSEAEAVAILSGIKQKYEEHHKVTISQEAIYAAVKLADRYINDRKLPDKAIDLIDEASSAIKLKGMRVPDSCRALAKNIKEADETIDKWIKAEVDPSQISQLRRNRDAMQEKYEKARKRYEKNRYSTELVVTQEDIAGVVSRWTKIPLEKLAEKESERLLKLEDTLHKRVIGQDEAVTAVAKAIRRGRVGLADPNKPIGSFLFLGPTGVGKTELSKSLAEVMFGNENELIRVDMSEFMEQHSVAKMIGSPPGYVGHEEGGQLADKVRSHPYSVVLFDEIEKAHPDVFNILLQVLDEGHITDSKGRKVSFKNTIIIMTSNAGAMKIVEPKNLGFAAKTSVEQNYQKMKEGVMEEVKRLFKPEFINRIDEIMVFRQLEKKQLEQIVTVLSKNLIKRCKQQMGIDLTISSSLKAYLIKKHCDVKMGARPLKRALQSEVEDKMAEEILAGKMKAGDKVTATALKDVVVFKVKE